MLQMIDNNFVVICFLLNSFTIKDNFFLLYFPCYKDKSFMLMSRCIIFHQVKLLGTS